VSEDAYTAIEAGAWVSSSPDETFRLGMQLGANLKGGELLLLSGGLGAGKTLFAKGIAGGLGIDTDEVTSPSFTLVNRYEGRLRLYHIDLYRLSEGPSAAHAVDLNELLEEKQAVFLIEWGERLGAYRLPPTTWKVTLLGDGDDPRKITFERLSPLES
jgi:tRNA threonylcarbamoyladenosine biosynthesis protein TsaE